MIKRFSFDFENNIVPTAYHTYGAAVKIKNKIKLLPGVNERLGSVFMNQKFRTSSFAVDLIFQIVSEDKDSDGFVMWYSPEVPKVSADSKRIHGVNEEMKGLALWFHKNQVGKWRIFSHYDQGNNKIEDGKILPENS